MNGKITKLNIATSLLLQIAIIINGFVVPKIILSYFGSEVNGLVSSISQFLNYIQLLEGGLSGVAMASLYKAFASRDEERLSAIIVAIEKFFKKIGIIYLGYAVLLSLVYPLFSKDSFSYTYVLSLVLIIAVGTFVQYYFSLTYRVLLNADRKVYIVSLSQFCFVVLNIVFALLSIRIYKEIHFFKLFCSLAIFLQPIVFSIYVRKHYNLDKKVLPDHDSIKQRWDGFGQNLAFFIHSNTDIVILTLLTDLKTVSIYSVHILITNAVKTLIIAVSGAVKPSFGNILAADSKDETDYFFDKFELLICIITTFSYSCCIALLSSFVSVYTSNISDANYYQPIFAILISMAEGVYCLRDPYVSVAYAAGHFKQTARYAYLEAIINICISLVLVYKLGLIGVAIGTLVAMVFRMVAHIIYMKKNIMMRPIKYSIYSILTFVLFCSSAIIVSQFINHSMTSYFEWIINAIVVAVGYGVLIVGVAFVFKRNLLMEMLPSFLKRNKKNI